MITAEDVKSVAKALGMKVGEGDVQRVLSEHIGYVSADPTATWDLVVEQQLSEIVNENKAGARTKSNVRQINIFAHSTTVRTRGICVKVAPDGVTGDLRVASWTTTSSTVEQLEDEFSLKEIKSLCEDVIRACLNRANEEIRQNAILANRYQLDVSFCYRDDGSGIIDTRVFMPEPGDVTEPTDIVDLSAK